MLLINSKIGDNKYGTNSSVLNLSLGCPYGTKSEPFNGKTEAFGRYFSFVKNKF